MFAVVVVFVTVCWMIVVVVADSERDMFGEGMWVGEGCVWERECVGSGN